MKILKLKLKNQTHEENDFYQEQNRQNSPIKIIKDENYPEKDDQVQRRTHRKIDTRETKRVKLPENHRK